MFNIIKSMSIDIVIIILGDIIIIKSKLFIICLLWNL